MSIALAYALSDSSNSLHNPSSTIGRRISKLPPRRFAKPASHKALFILQWMQTRLGVDHFATVSLFCAFRSKAGYARIPTKLTRQGKFLRSLCLNLPYY
jgi:hypothetical protein